MKLQKLLQQNRNEIIKIAAKHGAYNVRVFGSVARGEETVKSDIDLSKLTVEATKNNF